SHDFPVAQPQLRDTEGHRERQTDGRRRARVEIRGECHRRTGFYHPSGGCVLALAEEYHRRGKEDGQRLAAGEGADAGVGDPGQVVRGKRLETDRELGAAAAIQLIRVELQRETVSPRSREDRTSLG